MGRLERTSVQGGPARSPVSPSQPIPQSNEGEDEMSGTKLAAACIVSLSASSACFAGVGLATAPPVGQLPAGPSSSIVTARGELVAIALPHRSGGRVWRIAKAPNAAVLREVSEADV